MMVLILSPKDSLPKLILENVESFAQEGNTLLVVFEDGRARNYPLVHLWYYESTLNSYVSSKLKTGE